MIGFRGWNFPEQHLLPDAVVALVDGELSALAHDRAMMHVMQCPSCAHEVAAQRQARTAVRTAHAPLVPPGLLANLRAIPQSAELTGTPEGLAVTADGQLVAVQRPDRWAALSGSTSARIEPRNTVIGPAQSRAHRDLPR